MVPPHNKPIGPTGVDSVESTDRSYSLKCILVLKCHNCWRDDSFVLLKSHFFSYLTLTYCLRPDLHIGCFFISSLSLSLSPLSSSSFSLTVDYQQTLLLWLFFLSSIKMWFVVWIAVTRSAAPCLEWKSTGIIIGSRSCGVNRLMLPGHRDECRIFVS